VDKQEAQKVLQALRPSDLDTTEPAFAEALDLLESDPELQAWWEAQQAFDRAVVAKLKEVPIPDDLRAAILASRKIEPFRPPPQFSFWLAAAAVLAIFCALGTSQYVQNFGPLPRSEYTASVLPFLGNNAPSLAMTSADRDKIDAWLHENNAPTANLPPKMAGIPTVGCQKFSVHGHAVSLVCFVMANGAIVHLFTVDKQALTDPPTTPEMDHIEGWCIASWSDARMSYILATEADPDVFKQLL
jgi:hypothetical protein